MCVRVFACLMPQFMLNTLGIYSEGEFRCRLFWYNGQNFSRHPFKLQNFIQHGCCVCVCIFSLSLSLGRLSGMNSSRTCKHACTPPKWCMIYLSSMVENEIKFFLLFIFFCCCCRPFTDLYKCIRCLCAPLISQISISMLGKF